MTDRAKIALSKEVVEAVCKAINIPNKNIVRLKLDCEPGKPACVYIERYIEAVEVEVMIQGIFRG